MESIAIASLFLGYLKNPWRCARFLCNFSRFARLACSPRTVLAHFDQPAAFGLISFAIRAQCSLLSTMLGPFSQKAFLDLRASFFTRPIDAETSLNAKSGAIPGTRKRHFGANRHSTSRLYATCIQRVIFPFTQGLLPAFSLPNPHAL